MAVALSRTRSGHLHLERKFKEQQHEEIAINNMNNKNNTLIEQKSAMVHVVYYLSRNGLLEHPHFLEVPLSSPQGLFLRDVIHRLNLLRGKSMASRYSWSSKRSYKNGYVWHDLEENDFIYPVQGKEYVLKGSEILETTTLLPPTVSKSQETTSSSSVKNSSTQSAGDSEFSASSAARNRQRNQSWGTIDLHEYKVYKTESTREFAAADASTQTDDKRRRRKAVIKEERDVEEEEKERKEKEEQCSTELSRGEISPPPLDSSPETLETLINSDGRLILNTTTTNNNNCVNAASSSTSSSSQTVDQSVGVVHRTAEYCPSGRMKASSILMSLISCGSISFRDCGSNAVNGHGLSLISPYKPRLPHGENKMMDDDGIKNDNDGMMMEIMEKNVSSSFAKMALEDKEYFSGSLIETKKKNYNDDNQLISLKRSSSYNADRSSHSKLEGKEVDGVRAAKCIPRRPKAQPINEKEYISDTINSPHNASQN